MNKILKSLTTALTLTLFTATLVVPPVALTGCASLDNPETFALLLLDARDISEAGTVAALLENESFRGALEKTRDALKELEKLPDGQITSNMLIQALANLPIGELQSEKGVIYVTAGKIILRRAIRSFDLGDTSRIKAVSTALREGVEAGLGTVKKPVS